MESSSIIEQVRALSYVGLFGISMIANIVVPVPEEIVILAIGYAIGLGHFSFFPTLGIVILGTFIIDLVMFFLSRTNNRFVVGFYEKVFSRLFPINRDFLTKHAEKLIFFSRFLVQLRFLGPFIAGQVRVSWKKFCAYDFAAVVVYISGLLFAGMYFAKRIERIFEGVHQARNIILMIAGLMVLWSIGKIVRNKFLEYVK